MDFLVRFMADLLVLPVVAIAVIVVLRLPRERRWQAVTRGGVVALTALLFAKIASQFYQGVRPFEAMGLEAGASFLPNPGFPSDHALLVFTATVVVWASTQRRTVSLVLLLMSSLVALGRVLALVHTSFDVIGGAFCALLAGMVWYGPWLRQKFYRK